MDQPFWGQRVFDLGVGAQPLPRKQITADRLAKAIAMTVNDKDRKRRASAKAVELMTRYLSTQ